MTTGALSSAGLDAVPVFDISCRLCLMEMLREELVEERVLLLWKTIDAGFGSLLRFDIVL